MKTLKVDENKNLLSPTHHAKISQSKYPGNMLISSLYNEHICI